MNREITNQNLHLLLPGKVIAVVDREVTEKGIPPLEALRSFYKSRTYHLLEDESTKLWHYGPVALYEEYNETN